LPDLEGDFKGAKQKQAMIYERPVPDIALPKHLRVGLGSTIRLGELEVTPVRVQLKRIKIVSGRQLELARRDSLVLQLCCKNLSEAVAFSPTDPFFDRFWKTPADGSKPYTFVEIADQRFYGGPVPWTRDSLANRDAVEGQEYRVLNPGEKLTTIACTDPGEPIPEILEKYHGPLTWRLQLRRGLVPVRRREVPATAVIGVTFDAADIQKSHG
jgi:hypothetical protein